MWKDLFQEIETFKQPSAWLKMKQEIDKKGLSKSVTQIKSKLRNMKDAYKKAKTGNSQTGTSPIFSPFYNDFKELLGSRDVGIISTLKKLGQAFLQTRLMTQEKVCNLALQSWTSVSETCFFQARQFWVQSI